MHLLGLAYSSDWLREPKSGVAWRDATVLGYYACVSTDGA